MKVVFVSKDEEIQNLASNLTGHECQYFSDYEEILSHVKTPESQIFIFIDWDDARKEGENLNQQLMLNPMLIRFVMSSQLSVKELREHQGSAFAADGYVRKPVDGTVIDELLNDFGSGPQESDNSGGDDSLVAIDIEFDGEDASFSKSVQEMGTGVRELIKDQEILEKENLNQHEANKTIQKKFDSVFESTESKSPQEVTMSDDEKPKKNQEDQLEEGKTHLSFDMADLNNLPDESEEERDKKTDVKAAEPPKDAEEVMKSDENQGDDEGLEFDLSLDDDGTHSKALQGQDLQDSDQDEGALDLDDSEDTVIELRGEGEQGDDEPLLDQDDDGLVIDDLEGTVVQSSSSVEEVREADSDLTSDPPASEEELLAEVTSLEVKKPATSIENQNEETQSTQLTAQTLVAPNLEESQTDLTLGDEPTELESTEVTRVGTVETEDKTLGGGSDEIGEESNPTIIVNQVRGINVDEVEDEDEKTKIFTKQELPSQLYQQPEYRPEDEFNWDDLGQGANRDQLLQVQATLRRLREERQELLDQNKVLRQELMLMEQENLGLKAELDETKIELSILKKRHIEDQEEVHYRMRVAEEKKDIMAQKVKNYQKEFERLNSKVQLDLAEVRRREKELESQLELMSIDTQAQVKSRDVKILELKRKIDALEFNIENASIKEQQAKEEKVHLEERLQKIMKTLRGSIKVLENDIETQIDEFDDSKE